MKLKLIPKHLNPAQPLVFKSTGEKTEEVPQVDVSQYIPTSTIPVDNTRVVINPSMSPATSDDRKRLTDAHDRMVQALAEGVYSVLRFTPYIKYLTDFGDIFGVNPANYGKAYSYDATDALGLAGLAIEDFSNYEAGVEAKGGTYETTIGRGKNKRKVTLQRSGPNGEGTKFFKTFGKYNPLKLAGIMGDVIQAADAVKELHAANKNLQETEQSINWKEQPFTIDTQASKEANDEFNSQFIKHF